MAHARFALVLSVLGCWLALAAPPARAQVACAGDCGGDGSVTIADLYQMINIALGAAPTGDCVNGDVDHDGEIRVDEILAGLHVAFFACPALTIDVATEARCDPLADPCMLPLPNDYFTVAADTATGRRLALVAESRAADPPRR
jgi:hypothetical protein